ncbi:Urease operon transcriptional activator [Burkholderia sp. AD24]|nr:Urease operon transcriptional activator [Burkholderia sp. AD24]
MGSKATSAVRLASGPRTVLMRPDVGAAGHIVQRSDLSSHRVMVEQATLILVEDGRKRISWSGGDCVASAGEALSLQAGEVVDIANTPGQSGAYRALWICWCAELLEKAGVIGGTARPGVAVHTGLGEAFQMSFYRAFDGLGDVEALPQSIATSRLKEVLLWLAERDFHFSLPGMASPGQQVRRLLSTDPSIAWSMERVAQETATSIPTLRRRLAAEGIVFRELVQDVRMQHALALLQNTDASVLNIALATGYASPSRFAARFRARFGYLPTDIRGQSRGRNASLPANERTSDAI